MEALKDDPELAHVFEDIKTSGPAAMERYWNDTELMSKISQKMSALGVSPAAPPATQAKSLPVRTPPPQQRPAVAAAAAQPRLQAPGFW